MQGGELGPNQIHTIAEWFPDYQVSTAYPNVLKYWDT